MALLLRSISFFLIFCFSVFFSFSVQSVLEKHEDFSHKKIVWSLAIPAKELDSEEQSLHAISQRIQQYKKEVLFVSKQKSSPSTPQKPSIDIDQIVEILSRPQEPSSRTLWNEFQHRLEGLKLSPEDRSALYKSLSPVRKIIENPDQHLSEVTFAHCKMDDAHLIKVLHFLNDCPSLRFIDLSNNNLSLESMKRIVGFIRRSPRIEFVDLSHNSFSVRDFTQELDSPMVDQTFSDIDVLERLILTTRIEDLEGGIFERKTWKEKHRRFFDRKLSPMEDMMGKLKLEGDG